MTIEEERINQIKQFASQCYEDGERYSAFFSGAIWADDNPAQDVVNLNCVWHGASEEPQGYNYEILCVDILDMNFVCSGVIDLLSNRNWDERRGVVKMWAYISDLLPKGGER